MDYPKGERELAHAMERYNLFSGGCASVTIQSKEVRHFPHLQSVIYNFF